MATEDNPIAKLYKLLVEKKCVCNARNDVCLERLSVFQDWIEMGVAGADAESLTRGQAGISEKDEEKTRTEYSESWIKKCRERILLCLTVGRELFEARHCKMLRCLQQKIVGTGMALEAMSKFMASEDRLVAFSACKMTVALLRSCLLDKDAVATFFRQRLQISLSTIKTITQKTGHKGSFNQSHGQASFEIGKQSQAISDQVDPGQVNIDLIGYSQCNHYCEKNNPGQNFEGQVMEKLKSEYTSLTDINPGQINQAVFTFDLCKLLLIQIGQECLKGKEKRDSVHGDRPCSMDSLMSAEDRCARLKDIQAQLVCILNDILPELLTAFTEPASTKITHFPRFAAGSDNCHENVSLILASFSDLLYSLLKLGTSEQCRPTFTSLSAPIMDLLREYCGNIILVKKNLDILVLFMKHSLHVVPSRQPDSCDGTSAVYNSDLVNMATVFVDMVAEGDILECILYRNGPVGFGGSCFHLTECYDVNQEFGDRPLLRKLCQATFSALRVLLVCDSSERNLDETGLMKCLQALSQYVCAKLNIADVDSAVHAWLFECFADQDDSLVWAMHCILDLHKATASRKPPSAVLDHWLNPHLIFRGFLDTVGYDPSLLLDLLISSETPFLEYLVQYLHTVIKDWDLFQKTHRSVSFRNPKSDSGESCDVRDKTDKEFAGDDDASSKKVLNASHLESCEDKSPKSKRRKTEIQGDGLVKNQPETLLLDVGQSCASKTQTSPIIQTSQQNASDRSSNLNACFGDCHMHGALLDNNSGLMNTLDDVMTTLIRLRLSIERINNSNLFPYPVGPLLRLLEGVESLYEAVG